MEAKILLILGVTGVGKSTIIKNLLRLDKQFVYIKPYTNRPNRPRENEKIYMPTDQLQLLKNFDDILIWNEIHGFIYVTPKKIIYESLANSQYPLLDFPIQRLSEIKKLLPGRIYSIYVLPESVEALKSRLTYGRDNRLDTAIKELEQVKEKELTGYDEILINYYGRNRAVSKKIYKLYLKANK